MREDDKSRGIVDLGSVGSSGGPDLDSQASANLAPPLNADHLLEVFASNHKVVMLVLDKFESQVVSYLEVELDAAEGDLKRLMNMAHTLKGSLGLLRAERATGMAANLEGAARADDAPAARLMIGILKGELQRCLDHLPITRSIVQSRQAA